MIQVYFYKKNFQVQKTERFFKERRIPVQLVDLSRARLGRRELEAVKARVGLDALVDRGVEGMPRALCGGGGSRF